MKLLVIGGTRFAGRHVAEAALAAGHEVTLFNRGRSGPAPRGATAIVGDRRGELSALGAGRWDAVVDTCGYLPREVASMAKALAGRVGRYLFVSTLSVYASNEAPNDERAALSTELDDPQTDVVDGETYGPLKARCELVLEDEVGAAAVVLRPGLIVGPYDPTQRFTYWVARAARARGGEPMLVPAPADAPLQFVDARDLAAFSLRLLADGTRGTFNVVGPPAVTTMGALIDACVAAAGTRPVLRWVDIAALQAQGLEPWRDLPLALPATPEHAAFMLTPNSRAVAAGLAIRPLADTVAATLAWWRSLPAAAQGFDQAGLEPEREAAVLAALGAAHTAV